MPGRPRLLPRRSDLDGFIGLALDNLVQLLLIVGLCSELLEFPDELLIGRLIPGSALSVAVGCFLFARYARQIGETATALPFGISTVSLLANVFLVMLPAKLGAEAAGASTGEAARVAWQAGLAASFLLALGVVVGSRVADAVRRHTPQPALLAALAGIAMTFIALDFAARLFESPLVAIVPFGIVLATYLARARLPLGIPGGAWALVVGTAMAWLLVAVGQPSPVDASALREAGNWIGIWIPLPVVGDLIAGLASPTVHRLILPVIVPLALTNVLGSLQNVESAAAAGDEYSASKALAISGLCSMGGAAFGSCFPNTIYIGHPGWKQMGARWRYSVFNAIFVLVIGILGVTRAVGMVVPIEAVAGIMVWIGLMVVTQAFSTPNVREIPAVALGTLPALAAWGASIASRTLHAVTAAGAPPELLADLENRQALFHQAGLHANGLVALGHGFLCTSIIWSAAALHLIDRQFARAAAWLTLGSLFSLAGIIHSGRLLGRGQTIDFGQAWPWALSYLILAGLCGAMWLSSRKQP